MQTEGGSAPSPGAVDCTRQLWPGPSPGSSAAVSRPAESFAGCRGGLASVVDEALGEPVDGDVAGDAADELVGVVVGELAVALVVGEEADAAFPFVAVPA